MSYQEKCNWCDDIRKNIDQLWADMKTKVNWKVFVLVVGLFAMSYGAVYYTLQDVKERVIVLQTLMQQVKTSCKDESGINGDAYAHERSYHELRPSNSSY